jgi:hypothetical protein
MGLVDILGLVFSGGATGLIGAGLQLLFTFLTKREETKLLKVKHEFELDKRRLDLQIMQGEAASKERITVIEADAARDVEDARTRSSSYDLEPKSYTANQKLTPNQLWLMVALDFARGIIRPGLTIYLCVQTTMIYYTAVAVIKTLQSHGFNNEQAYQLVWLIAAHILYLTSTCVTWWFGSRPPKPPKTADNS